MAAYRTLTTLVAFRCTLTKISVKHFHQMTGFLRIEVTCVFSIRGFWLSQYTDVSFAFSSSRPSKSLGALEISLLNNKIVSLAVFDVFTNRMANRQTFFKQTISYPVKRWPTLNGIFKAKSMWAYREGVYGTHSCHIDTLWNKPKFKLLLYCLQQIN